VVYVLRNPADMLVSTFKFVQSLKQDEFTGMFEELFEIFMQNKLWYGEWWKHVDGYASLANVHVLHYENMLEV
jgi:hypothetical protein